MPACFTRLRLVGFKSFAEPVTIEILPGLTGIVGPNGCGKSNVVEALRFVMGEASAKSMRSGEMEDVIFAGTAARPARNLAEVTLAIEAGDSPLPVPFHEAAELVISRGVERARGSTFRINGREVRARDVQTLFADLGSGPRASAMITQGRITALVGGRAEERRLLLEEAAGITGLHARRHEAELKLAAAEANLARAEEVRAGLEAQLAALRRQARQASRYRHLGDAIRAAEADLLAIARARAEAMRAAAEQALRAARLALADRTAVAERAGARAAETAAALPEKREAEAASRTALERARLGREQIAADEARVRAELEACAARLAELDRDLAHGAALASDAAAAEARLAAEAGDLAASLLRRPAEAEAAGAAVAEATAAAEAAEAAADRAAEAAAGVLARAGALEQERRRLEDRQRRLIADEARLAAEETRLAAAAVDTLRLEAAAGEEAASEAALQAARAERDRCAASRQAAAAAHEAAREKLAQAVAERTRLAAETEALAAVLAAGGEPGAEGPSLGETLIVPAGLEAAVSAALGSALEAAASRWRALPAGGAAAASLPEATIPLDALLPVPAALARVLPLVGVIENAELGERLQAALAPGQALVTRDGGLWRWDGYSLKPGTESVGAVRMVARNRLLLLGDQLRAAEESAASAQAAREAVAAFESAASRAAAEAEAGHRGAEQRSEKLRRAADALRREAAAVAAHREALALHTERIGSERSELERALAALLAECANLPDPAAARAVLEAARGELAAARGCEAVARSEQSALAERSAADSARQSAIARERKDWAERSEAAAARTSELASRRALLASEHAALATRPQELARTAAQALDALEAAEEAHRQIQQRLAGAEQDAEAAARALRSAEHDRGSAREQALLCESSLREAEAALATVDEQIRERLGAHAALPEAATAADAEQAARRRLERLMREREAMGPVNLRAEMEAGEIETRIAAITREGEELIGAIAKLRGSIGYLNREGRSRLSAMFAEVDRHFHALFQRMFGGGRAHLALVGSDDPLSAGLEIYAEPPGKKLAQLSLLSGGEQALIALSLIFAVFRCNPAPIAVLDEVDAPLDDVNVGRFCALVEDVVRESGTRMLIATHHPLTMARMQRLYGVTMQERGVSRLISVDLASAVEMADPPRMAAE